MSDSDGSIRVSGRLVCRTAEEAAIVERLLPEHVRLTREEPGCRHFDVVQANDPLCWIVSEEFADRAAFDVHQQRTKASQWGIETAGIEREYRIFSGQSDPEG